MSSFYDDNYMGYPVPCLLDNETCLHGSCIDAAREKADPNHMSHVTHEVQMTFTRLEQEDITELGSATQQFTEGLSIIEGVVVARGTMLFCASVGRSACDAYEENA